MKNISHVQLLFLALFVTCYAQPSDKPPVLDAEAREIALFHARAQAERQAKEEADRKAQLKADRMAEQDAAPRIIEATEEGARKAEQAGPPQAANSGLGVLDAIKAVISGRL